MTLAGRQTSLKRKPRLKSFKSRSNFKVKNYCTMWKILSQTIQICNMKALALLIRTLWPRLFFFKYKPRLFFLNISQTSRSRSRGQNFSTMWKIFPQGIHMCNMKALSLLVIKLWPKLEFFKRRSNFKVKVTRSKIMVPCERSCHKQYTCAIWKLYHDWFYIIMKVKAKFKVFVHASAIQRRRGHQGYDIS